MKSNNSRLIVSVVAVVACLVIIIAPLIAINLLSQTQKYHNIYANGRFGGVSTTEKTITSVDDSLSRYINLSSSIGTSEGSQGYSWTIVNTNVTWIGTAKTQLRPYRTFT